MIDHDGSRRDLRRRAYVSGAGSFCE